MAGDPEDSKAIPIEGIFVRIVFRGVGKIGGGATRLGLIIFSGDRQKKAHPKRSEERNSDVPVEKPARPGRPTQAGTHDETP